MCLGVVVVLNVEVLMWAGSRNVYVGGKREPHDGRRHDVTVERVECMSSGLGCSWAEVVLFENRTHVETK